MSEFADALSRNGDSGCTYNFRRRGHERFTDDTYTETLAIIESELGRSAVMSVLELGKNGPVGKIKLLPGLSSQEIGTLNEHGVTAEAA